MSSRVVVTTLCPAGARSGPIRAQLLTTALPPGAESWTVDLCEPNRHDIVAVVSVRPAAGVDVDAYVATLATGIRIGNAWLVDERPQWDGLGSEEARSPVPGVKRMSFVPRAAGISRADFGVHWSDLHAPLARRHHPALWRYTQNVVVRPLLEAHELAQIDGIAELTMRLRQDFVDRMYDDEAGRQIIAGDVSRFINLKGAWRLSTREYQRTPNAYSDVVRSTTAG